MKRCSHCNKSLPESEYYPDKRVNNRLMAHCKDCHAKMQGNVRLCNQVRKCRHCSKEFKPETNQQRYCSDICTNMGERKTARLSRNKYKPAYAKRFWEEELWKSQEPDMIYTAKNGYEWAIFKYVHIGWHRVIMMRHIGRRLERWEQVHHKNRNKSDNSIENLELTPHGHNYVIIGVLESEIRKLKLENNKLKEELDFMKTIKQVEVEV